MKDEDGRHADIMTQLLRHVTPSSHDADVNGDIFTPNIYPPSKIFYIRGVTVGDGTHPLSVV